jgi:hypothetical protein
MTLSAGTLRARLEYKPEAGVFVGRLDRARKGTFDKKGYMVINIDGKKYLGHRLAYLYMNGKFPEHEVSFKDKNTSNCKWDNLIEVNPTQRALLSKSDTSSKSGVKGLNLDKRGFYVARVTLDKKPIQKSFKLDQKDEAVKWLESIRESIGVNKVKSKTNTGGYYYDVNHKWLKDKDKPVILKLTPVVKQEQPKVITKFEYGLSLLSNLVEQYS